MPRWSATDMPALDGRTAIVTGANSGIGYETALALAGHGAAVTMLVRDPSRGRAALDRLHAAVPGARVTLAVADLAPDVHGGDYVGPDGPTSMRGHPTLVAPPRHALDAELAATLWTASERLTGVTYLWP